MSNGTLFPCDQGYKEQEHHRDDEVARGSEWKLSVWGVSVRPVNIYLNVFKGLR